MIIAHRPNLFVIGSMKSGTTSLHNYLATHPQIYMSPSKEPCYFDRDDKGLESLERYLALFKGVKDEPVIGESSTQYTKARRISGVPGRIAQFSPNPYFIYLMRDPVERTVSHYWTAYQKHNERRDMMTAVRDDPDYTDFSYYAMQLSLYFELFGRERVKVIIFEEFKKDTRSIMQDVFEWLGVDPTHTSSLFAQPANVTPKELLSIRRGGVIHRILRSKFWSSQLRLLLPQLLRNQFRRQFAVRVDTSSELVKQVKSYLRPIQCEQVNELSYMLDRQFPQWKTLYGEDPSSLC